MAEFTLPLVGPPTQRGIDQWATANTDQRFIDCLFTVSDNNLTRDRNIFINKRPGIKTGTTINSGKQGLAICDAYGFKSVDGSGLIDHCTGFIDYQVGSNILYFYVSSTAIGVCTDGPAYPYYPNVYITKGIDASEQEIFIIVVSHYFAFYIGETGMTGGVTFTANTTNAAATLTSVSSFTGLVVGQKLSGTGIASTARIAVLDSGASKITMSANATATNSTVTITRERMAKIMDADFPTPVGPMQQLNGYYFVAKSRSRNIYQSAVNNVASWAAADYLTVDSTPGEIFGVSRSGNRIIAHKTDCIEVYYNNGNSSGSILSVDESARVLTSSGVNTTDINPSSNFYQFFSSVDDYVFTAQGRLYMTVNNSTKVISNYQIDNRLANAFSTNTWISAFNLCGKTYVYMRFANAIAFLYDVELNLWSEFRNTIYLIFAPHTGLVIHQSTEGRVDEFPFNGILDTAVYQDNGSSYTMTVQTNRTDFGYNGWKFIKEIHLLADNQSSGTATLERSTNDGASWDTIGTFDLTSQRKRITPGGAYEGQAQYRLTHSANTPFRASALKFIYDGRGG